MIKKNFPGFYQFMVGFFNAMSNNGKGQSLRKWLAVGFFWLTAVCVFRYTNSENVSVVLGILTAMITSLVVTYSVSNHQALKLGGNKTQDDTKKTDTPEQIG